MVKLRAQASGTGGSACPRQLLLQAQTIGHANTSFLEGTIEDLEALPLEPASSDLVVSNCVPNLSRDKPAVLRGVQRLLKPGGEFSFADVVADRRRPEAVRRDPVLYGECLGGALCWTAFLRLARGDGFADPRLVSARPLAITDPALAPLLGEARFSSATTRLFAIPGLEDACEDHGQAVIYAGTIPDHPHRFDLDGHPRIETGRVFPVCGNTFRMPRESRLAAHFRFIGDFERHYGPFAGCGSTLPFAGAGPSAAAEAGSRC